MIEKSYEEGLKEGVLLGEINALKKITAVHTIEIETLKKVSYGLVAVVGFIGIFPALKEMLS